MTDERQQEQGSKTDKARRPFPLGLGLRHARGSFPPGLGLGLSKAVRALPAEQELSKAVSALRSDLSNNAGRPLPSQPQMSNAGRPLPAKQELSKARRSLPSEQELSKARRPFPSRLGNNTGRRLPARLELSKDQAKWPLREATQFVRERRQKRASSAEGAAARIPGIMGASRSTVEIPTITVPDRSAARIPGVLAAGGSAEGFTGIPVIPVANGSAVGLPASNADQGGRNVRISATTVYDQAGLVAALAAAPTGTATTIELGGSFQVSSEIDIPANKNIILVSASGGTQGMQRAPGYTGFLLGTLSNATLTLSNIVIDGNAANVTAMYALIHIDYNSTLNITDGAVIQNNHSDNIVTSNNGGGVWVESGSLNMSGGAIINNYTANYGGGVATWGNFTMTGGEISGNQAVGNGGGVQVTSTNGAIFHLIDGLIVNNVANQGGGVAIQQGTYLVMDGGSISHNQVVPGISDQRGGGVYVLGAVGGPPSVFTMNAGVINDNTALYGGGVALTGGGTFVMNDGVLLSNHATGNGAGGGGIYLNFNAGPVTINGGGIYANDATEWGGGIYNSFGTVTINNAVVAGNYSGSKGGGIASYPFYNTNPLTITNSIITGNTATLGGGLYMIAGGYAAGTNTLENTEISNNTAELGGGAYNTDTLIISGSNSIISGNWATRDGCDTGGGIYSSPRVNTIINPGVIFTRNYATYAYHMTLGSDQSAYDSAVHQPSLDPQYDYAWNNADINWCANTTPTMQVTFWRNSSPDDTMKMIILADLVPGETVKEIQPPWPNSDLHFAGWSLIPNDRCPKPADPLPGTYDPTHFTPGSPPNLNVYAIWCPEFTYHDVTFDAMGGTPVPGQSILDGDPATYGYSTKAGCSLDGWYTDPNYKVKFNFNTPIYVDMTLYAKWNCPGTPGAGGGTGGTGSGNGANAAEEATLNDILTALEQGQNCYNIGILTEYGYEIVTRDGQLYLSNQLTPHEFLAIIPLTIADIKQDIANLKNGD